MDDRDRFQALADGSLAAVRASAEKWRAGLAALVTLVTGGLLIKGPADAASLTTFWLTVLTLLVGGGLLAAVYGLWHALRASAGTPETKQLDGIVQEYGSVLAYEVAQAKTATRDLRHARVALTVALPLLGAALIAWWWSDTKPPSPPAYVEVDVGDPKPICGTLKSADNSRLVIQVSGESNPRTFVFTTIKNIRIKAAC